MTWFLNNIGTIIVLAVLLAIVLLIVFRIKKDRSEGKTSCGCNCKDCAMHGSCHSVKK